MLCAVIAEVQSGSGVVLGVITEVWVGSESVLE
jgi:hypothetical protein